MHSGKVMQVTIAGEARGRLESEKRGAALLATQARRADKPHACMRLGEPGWPRQRWSLAIPEAALATEECLTSEEAAGLSSQKK